jgi:hypothetical protein
MGQHLSQLKQQLKVSFQLIQGHEQGVKDSLVHPRQQKLVA